MRNWFSEQLDRFGRRRFILVAALFIAAITWAILAAETGDDHVTTFDKIGIGVLTFLALGMAWDGPEE